ncbi:MAG: formate--tetrahydrofolate ligase [Thermoanaerobaculia bacterium]|nr:MAG: formate--tetrahydrofolate ligase [Thermoanaerobaculia bacterium]
MAHPGKVRPISEVARDLGIAAEHLIPYGTDKAKIRLEALAASKRPRGRLVLVTAITPTTAGEGKTTVSIGLAQGLAKLGERSCLALREPSLGPTFGMKGGATGGGASVLVPAEDVNLHFTGDFHAITSANNLLAAMLDNHLQQGNALGIDVRRVLWRRVLDLNDRALRHVVIGLGGALEGVPRETGFDITPASEVLAALCLSEDFDDLRRRLSRLIVALDRDGKPTTAADLKAVGALMVLLKDALHPNLVQTVEGVPAFVHGGPFANIAHGCNSVAATKMALAHADWVVTEAGFGADLGAEKFLDIKCRIAGLDPAAMVLVTTVRALKLHGGVREKEKYGVPDAAAVERGLPNLRKHVENAALFGLVPVVAINRFATDSAEEIEVVRRACAGMGVPCAVADIFAAGGEGGRELAAALIAHAPAKTAPYRPLYELDRPLKEKIETIATRIYGARSVAYAKAATRDLALIEKLGYGGLPVCMAKTQYSLSDDAQLAGRPENFDVTVRSVVLAAGAGFVVPLLGEIIRMPGLPLVPQAEKMDWVGGRVVNMLG